jgi:hypothetical protein
MVVKEYVLWEKPKINSKNSISVGDDLEHSFGYQLVLRGCMTSDVHGFPKYYGKCLVKLYPICIIYKGERVHFKYDPVLNKAWSYKSIVGWRKAELKFRVLDGRDLTPDNIMSKAMCSIESYIKEEYLPFILQSIENNDKESKSNERSK